MVDVYTQPLKYFPNRSIHNSRYFDELSTLKIVRSCCLPPGRHLKILSLTPSTMKYGFYNSPITTERDIVDNTIT